MPVKHCCYGDCNSDSRYVGIRQDMDEVTFIPFPKPKTKRETCERWVRLCGRQFFTLENIRKETYICSKHFVGEKGPTKDNPDPLPAVSTSFERNILSTKRKRKSPTKRLIPQKVTKRKRLIFQPEVDTVSSETVVLDHTYIKFDEPPTDTEPHPEPLSNDDDADMAQILGMYVCQILKYLFMPFIYL